MTLADFTAVDLIAPQLQGKDLQSVLLELSDLLEQAGRVPSASALYEAALKRELMVSTDMTPGMAFPHARLTDVRQLSFAFGRAAKPFNWSTQSRAPVRFVFLIVVSPADATQYLQLISGISRFSSETKKVERMQQARSATEILDLLREITVWNKPPAPAVAAGKAR